MKKVFIFCMFLLNTHFLIAQSVQINDRSLEYYIANTAMFEENQTPPHTPIAPFDSKEQIEGDSWINSQWIISLSGTWKFQWNDVPEKAPWDFFEPDFNVSEWDNIQVPSCWQMEGFGDPKFRNVSQPFPATPPDPPADYNPTGSYRREFTVPETWTGRRLLLYFEGVKTSAFIWVNGMYVGYNEGGMEPAEFDVTDVIKPGINQIAVQALRYADATYLECQDMWRLSGIYRPVYLLAMPAVHIRDYYVRTDLDKNYRDANLSVDIDILNSTTTTINDYNIKAHLLDANGQIISSIKKDIESIKANSTKTIIINDDIINPLKWSAEKPNLYSLIFELVDNDNHVIQVYKQAVGFREVEVHDQALWINGVQVKLNGVCSHVHHPTTGRTMNVKTMRQDLTIMKRFNINCVRTSHYPMNREYYALANQFGIYMIDETNDEAHATTWLSEKPEWREMYLDRVRKMVYRDRNQPSIIIWSAGNESGSGENICSLIAEGKRIDPSRPAWLYGGNNDYFPGNDPIDCEDIVGPRYPTPYELETRIAQSEDSRPSFMDEYVAVTGNSGGMFDEFWDIIRSYPRTTGGAVWDWVSPTVKTPWIETVDESPFGNNGAIMGRYQLVEGKFGKALSPSGQDTWVEIYRAPELDLDGEALTLSLWVHPNKWNGLESYITKGNWQFGLRQSSSDSVEFYLTTEKRASLKVLIPDNWTNNWHHLVANYDGKYMRVYIDGLESGAIKQEGKIVNAPFPINLCRNWETDDQNFTGNMSDALIDRVLIFNSSVTPTQVQSKRPDDAVLWLDFESTQEKETYYSYGIGGRTYGLIWADRKVQPELYQLKKSAQPVSAEPLDLSKGIVKIKNWHHFTNLKDVTTTWEITTDGRSVEKGTIDLNIPPLQSSEVVIPFTQPNPGTIQYLTLSWSAPDRTIWSEAGHEVAFVQFQLPIKTKLKKSSRTPTSNLIVEKSERMVTIKGDNFSYKFSQKTGTLVSLKFHDQEIIKTGPKMNVWRAPLANDLDGWTFGRARVINPHPALSRFPANAFWSSGLDRLEHKVDKFEVKELQDEIVVSIQTQVSTENNPTAFRNKYVYKIISTGDIILTHTITPEGVMPNYLPKMGLNMELDASFSHWKWNGRGPFETYPDRKTGARLGLWETTVDDAYVPYLIPQDHANRTDVSWSVHTNAEIGLFVQFDKPLNVSVQKWETDNLSRALLIPQLKPFNGITLNIDPQVSGVGCTAVSILNKYRVFPSEITYTIRFLPFNIKETDPTDLSYEKW
jgi:beta-galactosidase